MRTEILTLPPATPGVTRTLTVHRFGTPGARPRVHIQASLHADEIPAMLVAATLARRLAEREAAGGLAGEVVLVPVANPIGLAQSVLGQPSGRFDLADGRNFNRAFADLADAVAERVSARLGDDAEANRALVRAELTALAAAREAHGPAEHLKRTLLELAVQADLVLDLHTDEEAVMHLYTLPGSAGTFAPLARLLGAQAVFLAEVSGGDPFDEAVSRPWLELARRFPDRPIPFGGHAVTVELRGEADTDHALAEADAGAILGFLAHAGVLAGPPPALPEALCTPTPLESSEPVLAPVAGVVVHRVAVGTRVEAGTVIADIVDPLDGTITPVACSTAGLLYARKATRFAAPGTRLAKVAGTTLRRSGPLLSP